MTLAPRSLLLATTVSLAAALTACGGGGDVPTTSPSLTPSPSPSPAAATPNTLPIAQLVSVAEAEVGVPVTLDGRGSQDADGDTLTYTWSVVSKSAASTAAVTSNASAQASFTPDAGGTYVLALVVSDGKGLSAAVETTFMAYSTLSGVQPQQSVLTKQRSPYRLANDITVSQRAVFQVQPGVVILGQGKTLNVMGAVEIQGSASEPVTLNGLTLIRQGLELSASPNCHVSIAWATVTGGSVYTSGPRGEVCPLTLTDSQLKGTDPIAIIDGWGDYVIERNVFEKAGGISFEVGHAPYRSSMTIRNNRFVDWTGNFAIRSMGYTRRVDDLRAAVVSHNSFLAPGRVAVEVTPIGVQGGYLDASLNYWGTTDLAAIEAMATASTPQLAVQVTPALQAADPATP